MQEGFIMGAFIKRGCNRSMCSQLWGSLVPVGAVGGTAPTRLTFQVKYHWCNAQQGLWVYQSMAHFGILWTCWEEEGNTVSDNVLQSSQIQTQISCEGQQLRTDTYLKMFLSSYYSLDSGKWALPPSFMKLHSTKLHYILRCHLVLRNYILQNLKIWL